MTKLGITLGICLAALGGCSDSGERSEDPPLKAYRQALDKAKAVEGTIQDAADAQRRQMDRETQ